VEHTGFATKAVACRSCLYALGNYNGNIAVAMKILQWLLLMSEALDVL